MQHKGDMGRHRVGVSEVVGFLGHSLVRLDIVYLLKTKNLLLKILLQNNF